MNILFRLVGILGLLLVLIVGKIDLVLAANTGSQIVSYQTQQEIVSQKDQDLQNKIYKAKPKSDASKENLVAEKVPSAANSVEKFFISTIEVQGATILSAKEINNVIVHYQGKMLSLADAQKVADLISDIYRKKGFITSRAYLPPQNIKDSVLTVKVIEGKLGTVDIKGNKYFSTPLLKRELHMTKSGYFDYSALQKSLVYINQQPDRTASTVLVPGVEPGTTDVLVNVKDRLPIHAGFIYDNYGSRYVDSNRWALTLEDNNLLGFNDRMFAKVQTSDSNFMRFGQLQYVVPITETLNIGAYGLYSKLQLQKEFKALQATGTAKILGIFFDKALVQNTGFEWRLNGGFDYKNISNAYLGDLYKRDKERVLKLGTELDITDRFGRTIINPEIDVGLPNIFNGMDPKDGLASRDGSGGSFQKADMTLYRLQPLPFLTSLLWKNSGQWSHENLPAAEQFELGGPNSVRGYGPAEYSGDKGIYSALEWSVPFYFIPEGMRVPFTREENLKDSLRLMTFYDYGFAHLNNLAADEQKNTTLQAYGYGLHLNVRDNVSLRLEVGYPIGSRKPLDGSSAHLWVELTLRY